MERTSWRATGLVMSSSAPIELRAGAVMLEHNGERNANVEMMSEVWKCVSGDSDCVRSTYSPFLLLAPVLGVCWIIWPVPSHDDGVVGIVLALNHSHS